MILTAFDKDNLKAKLSALDDIHQLIFGASCCERLLPNLQAFHNETGKGDVGVVKAALDLVWQTILGRKQPIEVINAMNESCENAAPSSDDFECLLVTAAQDACFSVCCLLDFLILSDVERIAQAASYAIDTIDLYVQEISALKPSDPDLENKILIHPIMQQELYKQASDLDLITNQINLESTFVVQFRINSTNNGKGNLGLP